MKGAALAVMLTLGAFALASRSQSCASSFA
jgi:hypothetical protein